MAVAGNFSGSSDRKIILQVSGVSKNFGSVVTLNKVDLEVFEDEVVDLVGDNGAGKSTLIKILSENFPPDEGAVSREGNQSVSGFRLK